MPKSASITGPGADAATMTSTSPTVSENLRSDPQTEACVTPGSARRWATIRSASGSATEIGVRLPTPSASNRASDCASLSSDFGPKPLSARSLCSPSTRRRSSIDCTPSSARNRLTALGPSPWMRSSATTPGGCLARSPSSFCTFPVSTSSRIFSAVLLPIPSISCSSLTPSLPMSVACAAIAWAALS